MGGQPAAKNVLPGPLLPQTTRPRGPTVKVRRYGQNDFAKFDEENARGSFLSVGSGSVGKVDIECKYRWKQSRWGVLGPQNPAGIVYMDIMFHQPDGYWLKNAAVYITMGENEELTYAQGSPKDRSGAHEHAVQISEYFGPESLIGGKTSRTETKTTSVNPKVTAKDVAVEVISHTSNYTQERSRFWKFSGHVGQPRGYAGFRTLKWELIENDFDPDQPHSHEYRTAFAFEHSQRPVYMRVEIEGKLKSRSQRLLHKFLRFSSSMGNKDKSTLTYIDFRSGPRPTDRLDELARGLKMAMQLENCKSVPIEVPDPASARFFPDNDQAGNSHSREESGKGTVPDVDPSLQELRRPLGDHTPSLAGRLGLSEQKEYAESSSMPEDDDTDAPTLVNSGSTAATTKPNLPDKAQSEDAERLHENLAVSFLFGLIVSITKLFALASLFRGSPVSDPLEKESNTKTGKHVTSEPPQTPTKPQTQRPELLSSGLDHDADSLPLAPPGARQAALYQAATEKNLSRRSPEGHPLPRRKGWGGFFGKDQLGTGRRADGSRQR